MSSSPIFTLAFAAALGVGMVILSTRLKVPSIALLLLTGVAVGPEGMGILQPEALGPGLQHVVGMAVAIILFEGGLTLELQGARRSPVVIRRMLTMGVLVTWLGTTGIMWALFGLPLSMALLCGSLVIVTGPTVISPLLRRIAVRERLKHILYWEAVLVDAIGVFIAVLCFEALSPGDVHTTWGSVARFAARVALGSGIGAGVGALVAVILRRHLVPDEQANIFVLVMALLAYGVCEAILHESGILAVIVAGLVVGLTKPSHLEQLKRFKLELTELGIGMLFILLAATLELEPFLHYGWTLVAAVAVLLLVLRPLVVVMATWGRGFAIQEKIFLSWVAPRGIVAAFMASLFALSLARDPATAEAAELVRTFTFAVIGTTVILQGLSAPFLARLLGLEADRRRTWLIVGDDSVATDMAGALRDAGVPALALAPLDQAEPQMRSEMFLIRANPLDRELLDDPRFGDVGYVVTLSPNPYFNQLVCERWAELVGSASCFRAADPSIDGHLGFAGTPAWPNAVGPLELEQGLESGTLAIGPVDMVSPEDTERFGEHLMPLFWVDERAEASIWTDERAETLATGTIVAIRRRIPGLASLITDAVVVDDAQPDFELVVERLLEQAARSQPGMPVAELKRSIVDRERSMPTAMGSGIAIPHAYHGHAEHSQCYVANVRNGFDAPTPDGEPIRLVFLVLSPVGRAEEHLRSLASIAQLAHDPTYNKFLERQASSERLLQLILERA